MGKARAFRLHSSGLPTFKGRLLDASEVAEQICQGKFSTRWVVNRMAPDIGKKPGRQWLFYEEEARDWWAKCLETHRR